MPPKINWIIFISAFGLYINMALAQVHFNKMTGVFPSNLTTKSLKLFKYNTMFEQIFLADLPIINHHFEYISDDLTEIDAYMIQNTVNNQFFIFIWDNDLRIEIDSLQFWNSRVLNSPLTDSLIAYEQGIEKAIFPKIRHLDSLITFYEKDKVSYKAQLERLYTERANEMRIARMKYDDFCLNYFNTHLDSFVTLFTLTKIDGMAFDLDYYEFFHKLSDKLKKHSRAREYVSR